MRQVILLTVTAFLAIYLNYGIKYAYPIVLKTKKITSFILPNPKEKGLATNYNAKYNGSKTANGETLDIRTFTCAHPTYPFGTLLKITAVDSKKAIVVRVNDRGPFNKKYCISLTSAGMKTLDLDKKGHIPTVEIEALADTNTPVGLWGAAAADPSSSPKNTEQEEARPLKKTLHYLGTTPAATSDQAAAAAIKDPTDAATTFPSPPLPQSENTETPATTDEAAAVAAATAPPATSPPNEEPITAGKDDEPVVLQSVSYRSKVIESKGFAVQFAAMEDYERAMSIVQNLGDSDIKEVIVSKKTAKTNNLYKVFVGPFNTQEIAFLYLQHCRKAGFDCYVINLETMELLKDPSPAAKPVKRR